MNTEQAALHIANYLRQGYDAAVVRNKNKIVAVFRVRKGTGLLPGTHQIEYFRDLQSSLSTVKDALKERFAQYNGMPLSEAVREVNDNAVRGLDSGIRKIGKRYEVAAIEKDWWFADNYVDNPASWRYVRPRVGLAVSPVGQKTTRALIREVFGGSHEKKKANNEIKKTTLLSGATRGLRLV